MLVGQSYPRKGLCRSGFAAAVLELDGRRKLVQQLRVSAEADRGRQPTFPAISSERGTISGDIVNGFETVLICNDAKDTENYRSAVKWRNIAANMPQFLEKNTVYPDSEIQKDIEDTVRELISLRLHVEAREAFVNALKKALELRHG